MVKSIGVSSVGFADDISCISDKISQAQALANIASNEGEKLDIKFNQNKSVVITNDPNPPSVLMADPNSQHLAGSLDQILNLWRRTF